MVKIKTFDFNTEGLKEHGIIVSLTEDIKLDLIYNRHDGNIYVSVLDGTDNRVTGFNRVVPEINLLGLSRNKYKQQLRCIKVNKYAEERDLITVDNLNKDYKFFLI